MNATHAAGRVLHNALLVHAQPCDDGQQRVPCVGIREAFGEDIGALLLGVDVLDTDAAAVFNGAIQPCEIHCVFWRSQL